MKFPYGISDFKTLVTEGYYYCDRTDRIVQLEEAGKSVLFIRPRRFGKSLLLSTLRYYYDIDWKDRFDELFGHLAVGADPTPLRSRFLILRWDFSCVDSWGSPADIRRSLHNHVNACIEAFYRQYEKILPREFSPHPDDAVVSLKRLISDVLETGHPLYLLIDEYDNFANEVLAGVETSSDAYKALVQQNGPVKTLFKAVKSAIGANEIERVFITGVSPVVMSDITSGFNIAENIYLRPAFNDLCGFTEPEAKRVLETVCSECGFTDPQGIEALSLMRTYYNGYLFSPRSQEKIYNPTLVLYFLKLFQEDCRYPRKMLDANLAADEAKLDYIAQIPGGRRLLQDIVQGKPPVTVMDVIDRFGLKEMLTDRSKDRAFLVSFLYYFGVLTIAGDRPDGSLTLEAPNLVTKGLYVDRMRLMLLPEPVERDDGKAAAEQVYKIGHIDPLCRFVEDRFFRVFRTPDARWANELTVKTAFLTLLYNDILFIMDSERETGTGRADLTMIIRPDMRKYEICDVVMEFKYLPLKETGLSREKAAGLSPEELRNLPGMIRKVAEAKDQVNRYGDELERKYKNLRLKRFAVVSLGLERIFGVETISVRNSRK